MILAKVKAPETIDIDFWDVVADHNTISFVVGSNPVLIVVGWTAARRQERELLRGERKKRILACRFEFELSES